MHLASHSGAAMHWEAKPLLSADPKLALPVVVLLLLLDVVAASC